MAGSMQNEHRKALIGFGDSSLPPLYLDPILDYLEVKQVLPESKINEIRVRTHFILFMHPLYCV